MKNNCFAHHDGAEMSISEVIACIIPRKEK